MLPLGVREKRKKKYVPNKANAEDDSLERNTMKRTRSTRGESIDRRGFKPISKFTMSNSTNWYFTSRSTPRCHRMKYGAIGSVIDYQNEEIDLVLGVMGVCSSKNANISSSNLAIVVCCAQATISSSLIADSSRPPTWSFEIKFHRRRLVGQLLYHESVITKSSSSVHPSPLTEE